MHRKALALLWFLNVFAPLLGALTPPESVPCLVCQANNHALCEMEGHDCSHARAEGECPACKPKANRESLGHKCPQGAMSLDSIAEVARLPMLTEGMTVPAYSETVSAASEPRQPLPLAEVLEHPPQNRPA